MKHPDRMRPPALTLDPVDVARAQRGDKNAKNRVSSQKYRIRKRQEEIDAWDALNAARYCDTDNVSSFDIHDNNDDHDDHDERYV